MVFPWIVLILEGLICCVFQSEVTENNTVFCSIIIGVNAISVLGVTIVSKIDGNKKIMILGGYLLRILLLIWDLNFRHVFVLPNSGSDSESFANAAKRAYLYSTSSHLTGTYSDNYIRFWYQLFGVQRAIAQYTNILIFVSICYIVIMMLNYLKVKDSVCKLTVGMLCFLPNFAVLNSILLRETIVMIMVTISAYCFIRWLNEEKNFHLLLSVISSCVGAMFHSGAIAILLGEAIVYILYDRKLKKVQINRKSVLSLVFVISGFIIIQNYFGDTLFGKFSGAETIEDVISTADRYNDGGSAYDAGIKINNSLLNLIVNTPIRMFYFVASPVPWNWRGVSDIIAFLFSALVYLYAYYYAIKEVWFGKNSNHTLIIVLLIMSLASALIFAWGVSNAGTALRHREKFVVIYLLLLAVAKSGHVENGTEKSTKDMEILYYEQKV